MKDSTVRTEEIKTIRENFPGRFNDRRWVSWIKHPKRGKVPVDPKTGEWAKVNDPSTWGTFEEAAGRYLTYEADAYGFELAGVGINFSDDDPDAGLDYDDCLQDGQISPLARKGVESANTYTEISPSGKGLKLYGTGTLKSAIYPDDSGGKVEAYDRLRWFAVTGERFGESPKEIRDIQPVLDSAWYAFKTAKTNGNGEYKPPLDVAAILNGVPEGERDRKLFALACKLRRNGIPIDIATATVEKAAANCEPPFSAATARKKVDSAYSKYAPEPENGRIRIGPRVEESSEPVERGLLGRKMVGAAIDDGVEPPEMLLDKFLYAKKLQSWTGEAGFGKTLLAQWTAKKLIEAGRRVLYLDEEGSLSQVSERLEGLGADPQMVDERFFYFQSPGVTLDPYARARLMETIADLQPDLVIFDSWVDFLAIEGLDENNSIDVTRWIKLIAYPIRDAGCAVLLLDHVNKDNSGRGGRGSTAKLAKLDASYKLTQTVSFDRNSMGEVTLKREKDREAYMPKLTTFAIGGDGTGRIIVEPDSSTIRPDNADVLSPYDVEMLAALPAEGLRNNEWKRAANSKSNSKWTATRAKLIRLGYVETVDGEHTIYRPLSGPKGGPKPPDRSGPNRSETGPSPNGADRSDPANNHWSTGPRTTFGPLGSEGGPRSKPVSPPIGETTWTTSTHAEMTLDNNAPCGLKFKALAAIYAMEVGTRENPTYPKPPDFWMALAEKLGIPLTEARDLAGELDGDFDWTGLFGLYTNEEIGGM